MPRPKPPESALEFIGGCSTLRPVGATLVVARLRAETRQGGHQGRPYIARTCEGGHKTVDLAFSEFVTVGVSAELV